MSGFLQSIQSSLHGKMGGPQYVELSDFFSTSFRNSVKNLSVFRKSQVKLLTLLVIELLGVIQPIQGEAIRKDDCRRNDRTCQRSPTRLIDPCHGADPSGMKLLLMKKRRAPWLLSLGAPLRSWPATLVRHRADFWKKLSDLLRLLLHGDGGLALAVTEIVQLGTANRSALLDLELGNTGRMKGKHALDTLAEADATHGEVGIDAGALAADDDTCVLLDTLLVTFDDACVNADGITHLERDEVGFELLFFDGGDDAHVRNGGRKVV